MDRREDAIFKSAFHHASGRFDKKLPGTFNTVGFLIRHIADVELLFAKNVFGLTNVYVQGQTVISKTDTGEWTDLPTLLDYQQYAFEKLRESIRLQSEADWQQEVIVKEFGTKTKSEAFGRITTHTAYHAGQMALALKYAAL